MHDRKVGNAKGGGLNSRFGLMPFLESAKLEMA